jgi:hypothetical protein
MENLDALLAILLLKQPIAESFRVFNNPAKILLWTLLQSLNSKSSFCAYLHTYSMPSWQSIKNPQMILASNELTVEFFFYALLALAQCPTHRTPQSLLLNSEFLCALLALAQCPPGRALQNSSEILSATVFLHSLAS